MPDTSNSNSGGLGDLLGLLGGNPLAGVARTLGQLQEGVTQLVEAVSRFNDTMEQLNGVARRVNAFLDTVEEPVQTLVPQVTRTLKAVDTVTQQLQPLVQLAETAGGMFGLKALTSRLPGATPPAPAKPPVKKAAPAKKPAAKKPAPKKSAR